MKNLYKYTPIYSGGGVPEIYEADVFRIAIPLTKEAVKRPEMDTAACCQSNRAGRNDRTGKAGGSRTACKAD